MIGSERRPRIHCGTFDAETCWRDDKLTRLPSIPDLQTRNLVNAMDELLFVFCQKQDTLLTRYAMDEAHLHYLQDIGFRFTNNKVDLDVSLPPTASSEMNIFERLSAALPYMKLEELVQDVELEPFAILNGVDVLAEQQGWRFHAPSLQVIKHVNSKVYSTELKDKLGIWNVSQFIRSCTELDSIGKALLDSGPFLIKDTFGVSGKGNLLISTEGMLNRVSTYIAKQENNDRQTLFIVEPLLNKEMDFSCQFEILPDGSFSFISVQQVLNSDFAYQGSVTAAPPLIQRLEREGYWELMQAVSNSLYESGYFGHVCVDSMVLQDGSIVPLVEINARKSMSLIKHQLDMYLDAHSLEGYLTYVSMVGSTPIAFGDVLHAMENEGLLYKNGCRNGIIPLSANTFKVNQQRDGRYKARMYVSIVASDLVEGEQLSIRLRTLLSSLAITVSS
ncbi:Carbamoyl-phosphate synthase L chain, ATP binding domain [Paenibacillus sp. 1_12]|uniref:ATP-binding protein n=1 Tax=Paenibacillus sp. 1_12 TaxID=1566278 RepID=UPI0008ED356C|nr:hypothetical protein [Paenibacillus sp. 1_12]SFL80660.1 Carbamoyl-phosphate synthase L chain, ATP binding domain [Paenibacillus sp. 1_12]